MTNQTSLIKLIVDQGSSKRKSPSLVRFAALDWSTVHFLEWHVWQQWEWRISSSELYFPTQHHPCKSYRYRRWFYTLSKKSSVYNDNDKMSRWCLAWQEHVTHWLVRNGGKVSEKDAGGRFWMKPRHIYGWEKKKGQLAKPAGRQPKGPKGPHATPRHHLPRSQESFMGGTTPKPTEIACTVWWGRRRGGHAWRYPPSSVLYLWKLQKNTHAYTEARAEKGALERTRLRASCNKLAGQLNRHKGGLGALHSRMWMCCVAHESSKGPSCGATGAAVGSLIRFISRFTIHPCKKFYK